MTATLPWFSRSTQPPTDVAESLHSSPTTSPRDACCMRTGGASDGRKGGALKVNPMDDCYRRVRHERLLGKSADANDAFRTGWVPTTSTVHPEHPNAALGCGWRVFDCASSYFTD